MPIYEYQCTKCHHHLEALQKISDKPLRECPECGKHALQRMMSAPMFRLAGSGWYETDFKSDQERKRNLAGEKAESSDAAAASPKTEAKLEAKPEAKTETKAEASKEPAGKTSTRTMITKPAAKPAPRAAARKAKPAARKPARRTGKR